MIPRSHTNARRKITVTLTGPQYAAIMSSLRTGLQEEEFAERKRVYERAFIKMSRAWHERARGDDW